MPPTLAPLPDLACVAVCAVAAVLDLRTGKIPNWLTGAGLLLGLLLNTLVFALEGGIGVGLRLGLGGAALGAVSLLLCFGVFGLLNFVCMGDVKLMVAVGAMIRWPGSLWALVYVGLAGGVIALVYALYRGVLGQVLANIFRIGRKLVRRRGPEVVLHRIPYGLAILVGTAWAVARAYVPALRIP